MKIISLFLILLSIFLFNSSSFAQTQAGAAIEAIDERPMTGGGKAVSSAGEGQGKVSGPTRGVPSGSGKIKDKSGSKTVPRAPARRSSAQNKTPTPRYDGLVLGDKYSFLNFEIVSKVQPIYTIKAKNAGASGLVQVEVLVDENGDVLSAHARTGNALLHPEAEKAALATKFNKPTVYGKPARALGFVVYRFGKAEDDEDD